MYATHSVVPPLRQLRDVVGSCLYPSMRAAGGSEYCRGSFLCTIILPDLADCTGGFHLKNIVKYDHNMGAWQTSCQGPEAVYAYFSD